MQDMIDTPVSPAALQRYQIRNVLDHAHDRLITSLVGTNRAEFVFRKISAARTASHHARRFLKSGNQRRQLLRFFNEQVQRDPL